MTIQPASRSRLVQEPRAKRLIEGLLRRAGNETGRAKLFVYREGIREFNIKLLDIAQANMMAGMNFVSELTRVKGPTEAFELWSRHAENHLQRLSEQSQDLAKLGQRIASSSTEPLTRGVDQMFKRAS